MAEQVKEGWFHTDGRLGDRSLDEQLKGLDELRARVAGKSVLDVGCAEGLISMQLFDDGAAAVHGLEIVQGHVDVGNTLRGERAVTIEQADANDFKPKRQYDIVVMLAILHKLRDPGDACKRFAKAARELVVVRLPPENAPRIIDQRSDFKPVNIHKVLMNYGFERTTHGGIGPRDEWMGYYERRD
jgi:2-polyprenyl-3-methyl-5-hydroxy-6-metoxy-1,4-benzoquinol methylase